MNEDSIVRGDASVLLCAYATLTETSGIPAVYVINNQLFGEGMTREEAERVAVRLGLQKGDPGWKNVTQPARR